MSSELSERTQQVLKLVVEEYVATARPVGSEVLREKYGLSYSSATLRSEMAELERRGYLTHLHTSGGRVPVEAGYRVFVENLVDSIALSPAEVRRVEHQFHQIEGNPDLERWSQLAASVLAQLAHNAALVTTPWSADVTLRQIQMILLHDRSALVIAVMDEGSVRQFVSTLPFPATQEELNSVSAALTNEFAGLAPTEMPQKLPRLRGVAAEVAPQIVNTLGRTVGQATTSQSGVINMLSQPEFQQPERARTVIALIEGGSLMATLSNTLGSGHGVHVIIGSENPISELADCSVVTGTYRAPRGGSGLLTVVGPTRMPYRRTISSVYYLSQLLTDMLSSAEWQETIPGGE